MDYFVPHYELQEGTIVPVAGRPAKRVSIEQAFWLPAAPATGRAGLPPAVGDFLNTEGGDPEAILSFCNSYGILGVVAWDPFPIRWSTDLAQKRQEYLAGRMGPAHMARLMDISQEVPRRASDSPPTDEQSAIAQQPCSLTAALWLVEPLAAWHKAWRGFGSCFFLLLSTQALLIERHGGEGARTEAGPHAVEQLKRMAAALFAIVGDCMPQSIHEWFATWVPDSPPSQRLTSALAAIEYVSSTVLAGANIYLRPREDLVGWTHEVDHSCLLNLLYVALLNAFTQGRWGQQCALPGCQKLARAASAWCTDAHASTHRKRRERAVFRHCLSAEEASAMEDLVRARGVTHAEAARTVVAGRGKPRSKRVST